MKPDKALPWPLFFLASSLAAMLMLEGCTTDPPVPKPRGYHRIFLPTPDYQLFECDLCPFTFEYPTYSRAINLRPDSCLVNFYFDSLGAQWHLTLEELTPTYTYPMAYEKYRSLVYQHLKKGRIYESEIVGAQGVGRFFEAFGEVPTSAQFFFSDSVRYAAELSFYFDTAFLNDSLKPVIDHLKADMHHLLKTIKWKPGFAMPRTPVQCNSLK